MNPAISAAERLARIQVNAFPYFRADWLERLIRIFGSAQEILRQDAKTLAQEAQMNPATAQRFLKEACSIDPQQEWDRTAQLGGHIYLPEDEEYPLKSPPLFCMCLANCPRPNRPPWAWWARAK